MKIISPFRDYYDRVANSYGGGDPSIPYVRANGDSNYQRVSVQFITDMFGNSDFRKGLNNYLKQLHANDQFVFEIPSFRWLIFCGKQYLIIGNQVPHILPHEDKIQNKQPLKPSLGYITDRKVLSHKFNPDIYDYLINNSEYWDSFYYKRNRYGWNYHDTRLVYKIEQVIGKPNTMFDDIAKNLTNKLNRPIPMFIIERDDLNSSRRNWYYDKKEYPMNHIEVNANVCLNDLGFAAIMSAEEVYQEIESYIINVLRDNPDKLPPVEVSNVDKIKQHGFDTKISFRRRK